jgi:hypothetical protein
MGGGREEDEEKENEEDELRWEIKWTICACVSE